MGVKIKLPNVKTIDSRVQPNFIQNYNTKFNKAVLPLKRNKKTIPCSISENFSDAGCCTSLKYPIDHDGDDDYGYKGNHLMMAFKVSELPTMYRSFRFINEYVKFLNSTFKGFNIQILFHGKPRKITGELNNYELQSFDENYIYFVIPLNDQLGVNMLQIQMIRYLKDYYYLMMPYNLLSLRRKKSLNHLTNYDIMNICRYSVQVKLYNLYGSSHRPYLWEYRSGLENEFGRLLKYNTDLTSVSDNHASNVMSYPSRFITIPPKYLMYLYQEGKYLDILKLVTNKKYQGDVGISRQSVNDMINKVLSFSDDEFKKLSKRYEIK